MFKMFILSFSSHSRSYTDDETDKERDDRKTRMNGRPDHVDDVSHADPYLYDVKTGSSSRLGKKPHVSSCSSSSDVNCAGSDMTVSSSCSQWNGLMSLLCPRARSFSALMRSCQAGGIGI